MIKKQIKNYLLVVLLALVPTVAMAQYGSLDQYKGEIGVQGGCSFYLGDANPDVPFHKPQESFGAFFRYNINPRWAVKLAVSRNHVVGNTRDFKLKFPNDEQGSFNRKFWDASIRAEFNFFDYGLPTYNRECKWFSPYIFIGVGLTMYNNDFEDLNRLTVNMPFGVGMKFKFAKRFNVGVEWSLHQLFIDDFDVTNDNNKFLNNPTGAKQNIWKNNDKYSIALAYISIDIFRSRYCK